MLPRLSQSLFKSLRTWRGVLRMWVGAVCCIGTVFAPLAVAVSETPVLPLPRFASLRSEQVNMRAGPGLRYPVDWVYMRRFLPVEVVSEYESWRKVRDPDGAEGWVHRSMLSARRTGIIRASKAMLRRTADGGASPAAWLREGVVVRVHQCPQASPFCRVEVDSIHGWVLKREVWGVYKEEELG